MTVTFRDLMENLEGDDNYAYVDYLGERVAFVRDDRSRYYTLYVNHVLVCTRVRFDNAMRIAARHLSIILS